MSDLLKLSPAEFCRATKACVEGRKFALRYDTMADVWDNCPRTHWLLWISEKLSRRPDERTLRLFAVWCARNTPLGGGRITGDLLTDPRSLAALEVAGRYAEGRATKEELNAARLAAFDAAFDAAAYAASAADDAAAYAAYAASAAAYAAASSAAEGTSAYAAYASAAEGTSAYAAYASAAYADASAAADVVASRRAQADQLRRMVPNPFRAKEVKP